MRFPIWIVFGLISAIGAAGVTILGKLGLSGIDSTTATVARSAVMFVAVASFALATGKLNGVSQLGGKAWIFIILSGLCGAISWLAYFAGLRTGRSTGLLALDRLSIIMVAIIAIPVLGEDLTWKTALGSILIFTGAVLAAL